MQRTGIVLTTPGGNRFWHGCRDAAAGYKEMASISWTYGAAWEHADTVVEFGTVDGAGNFIPAERLWPKGAV